MAEIGERVKILETFGAHRKISAIKNPTSIDLSVTVTIFIIQ